MSGIISGVTHDAEVDRVPVAEERDIEPHTVGDDGRQR